MAKTLKAKLEEARFYVSGNEIGTSKEYTLEDLTIGRFDGFFHMSVQAYTVGYRASVYFQMAKSYDEYREGEIAETTPAGIDLTWSCDFLRESDIWEAWDRHFCAIRNRAAKEEIAQATKIARFTPCAHSVKVAPLPIAPLAPSADDRSFCIVASAANVYSGMRFSTIIAVNDNGMMLARLARRLQKYAEKHNTGIAYDVRACSPDEQTVYF